MDIAGVPVHRGDTVYHRCEAAVVIERRRHRLRLLIVDGCAKRWASGCDVQIQTLRWRSSSNEVTHGL